LLAVVLAVGPFPKLAAVVPVAIDPHGIAKLAGAEQQRKLL
jgi:hypothetical protein